MAPLPHHGKDAHILANIVANIVTALLDHPERDYNAFTPVTMQLPHLTILYA